MSPCNLQDSLIAFYSFGSRSINDISGNDFNLTNSTSASPAPDRAGNVNCAFNFNQLNGDYLTYANPSFVDDFQSIPFSISLWYKPLGTPNAIGYELLIGKVTNGQWSVALYDLRKAVFGINEYSTWQDDDDSANMWKPSLSQVTEQI